MWLSDPDGPAWRFAGRASSPLLELDDLFPCGPVDIEPERPDLRLQRGLGVGVAVDKEDAARTPLRLRQPTDPVEQLVLVGVRREAADRLDLAANIQLLAV